MSNTFFSVCNDEYTVSGFVGGLPATYSAIIDNALFHEDFGVTDQDGTTLVVTVERASENWPGFVVSQRFEPGPEAGFSPAAILVSEQHLLLIGAGTRLLAYDLETRRRLWEDVANAGFWMWKRHGEVILMSAELEFAAWDLRGKKLWTTYVEPPWHYETQGDSVELDVMGNISRFGLKAGPKR